MAKRKKNEISPSLKARDYKVGEIPIDEGRIVSIKDIETKYGDRSVITVDTTGGSKDIFLNDFSLNLLIDKFGDEDEDWIGKKITTKVEEDKTFKNRMIIVYPKGD